jgi:hypothetical protein
MCHASTNNVLGLRELFSCGQASGKDRTAAGWTPLHLAAPAGHVDSCRYLVGHGADVTSAGHVGVTPLHLAAAYGHMDVIKLPVGNEGNEGHPETDPLRIFFCSDLTSSTMLRSWSSVLLKLGLPVNMTRTFAILLSALAALGLGLGLLSMEFLIRGNTRRAVN